MIDERIVPKNEKLLDWDIDDKATDLWLQEKEERLKRLKETWPVELALRTRFAYILVILVGISNAVTLTIFFLLGFSISGFHLSDTVVVAIISATVAELASMFYIILRYLFPEPPPGKKNEVME